MNNEESKIDIAIDPTKELERQLSAKKEEYERLLEEYKELDGKYDKVYGYLYNARMIKRDIDDMIHVIKFVSSITLAGAYITFIINAGVCTPFFYACLRACAVFICFIFFVSGIMFISKYSDGCHSDKIND